MHQMGTSSGSGFITNGNLRTSYHLTERHKSIRLDSSGVRVRWIGRRVSVTYRNLRGAKAIAAFHNPTKKMAFGSVNGWLIKGTIKTACLKNGVKD